MRVSSSSAVAIVVRNRTEEALTKFPDLGSTYPSFIPPLISFCSTNSSSVIRCLRSSASFDGSW